jgi:predicted dienelactone hydrolase
MYFLEIVFLLATLGLLVSQVMRGASRRVRLSLLVVGLIGVALAFPLGQARIHMAPAALVFLIASLLLLRHGYSHIAVRALGIFLGLTFVAVSAVVALALPVVTLPAPDGPYTVGVTSFTLTDESRTDAVFGAPESLREIYVQVWYPGRIPDEGPTPEVRTLWQELYRSAVGKVVFGYLGGMDTHSFDGIPVASAAARYPAVVFSPALTGIAEQNTLLMEHLASHGYIAFAVTHPHFGLITAYPDGSGVPASPSVMEGMRQQAAVDLDKIAARAEQGANPIEQAAVWLDYFDQGETLKDLTDILVRDLVLLLDAITNPVAGLRAPLADYVDTRRIGMLAMSFGSGPVTEICKTDERCRTAVNLDGGLWGDSMREPLAVPYLVLASAGNRPFFEHDRLTSRAPYFVLTVADATHANFTDVSAFVPLFDWLGWTGPVEGERVIEIMNTVTRRFFDAYLRSGGGGAPDFRDLAGVSTDSDRAL